MVNMLALVGQLIFNIGQSVKYTAILGKLAIDRNSQGLPSNLPVRSTRLACGRSTGDHAVVTVDRTILGWPWTFYQMQKLLIFLRQLNDIFHLLSYAIYGSVGVSSI